MPDECPDLLATLGRHMGDQTVSYYIHSPSGFFVEYGWDGLSVDDLSRRSPGNINIRKGKRPDMWGHKYRLQPNETVYPCQPLPSPAGRLRPGADDAVSYRITPLVQCRAPRLR